MGEILSITETIVKHQDTDSYDFITIENIDMGEGQTVPRIKYQETYSLSGLQNRVESLTLELEKYNSLIQKINNL